jgi:hypothetical protein
MLTRLDWLLCQARDCQSTLTFLPQAIYSVLPRALLIKPVRLLHLDPSLLLSIASLFLMMPTPSFSPFGGLLHLLHWL